MIALHLAACLLALLAIFLVFPARHSSSRPIWLFCLGAAAWSGASAVVAALPGTAWSMTANALMLPAAAVSASAALVAARRLVDGNWVVPSWLLLVMALEPVAILGVRLLLLPDLTSAQFRETWWFYLHAAYCFALLLSVSFTVNARQRDPSRRVKTFVVVSQVMVISVIALEFSGRENAHLAVAVGAAFSAWVGRHYADWETSTARADSLLNSIGVFLFVFDREGGLKDWNSNASRLIELVTKSRPVRGTNVMEILACKLPFADGRVIDFDLAGGRLRTAANVHQVDPLARADQQTWVVMLRPVRSNLAGDSFAGISGELAGHDPSTQTLGRKATTKVLATAASHGKVAVRIDVRAADPAAREDELMFLIAGRLQAAFPEAQWGRLEKWVFVGVFEPSEGAKAKDLIDLASITGSELAATATTTLLVPDPTESGERFAHRVAVAQLDAG